jgi:hypothetical protein
MTIGSVQTLLVCVPAEYTQAPCPTGMAVTTRIGYVIDPASASAVEAQNAEFDYGYAAAVWSMGFTFVVALYLVSRSSGIILNAIRNL